MVEYSCDKCEFSTSNKTGYKRHCDSKKHLKKVQISINRTSDEPLDAARNSSKYICHYCQNTFKRQNNLTRHEIICARKKEEDSKKDNKIKEKDNKIKEYVDKIKLIEEQKNIYKREMNYYKALVTKSVSALTYVMTNYDNAPVIKEIDMTQFDNEDDKFIETIFHKHHNGQLHKYIGDIIVSCIRTKDPSKQALWNTDTSRLTYLLRKYMHDKESRWFVDKKGVETLEIVVAPVVSVVRELSIKYHRKICLNVDNIELSYLNLINDIFSSLIKDIDNQKLHDQILKYISPFLTLDAVKVPRMVL